jgi:hypothetical protein
MKKSEIEFDAALENLKFQLRCEKKSALIEQWIGLYAQTIALQTEIEKLKNMINSAAANKAAEVQQTETAASATEGEANV